MSEELERIQSSLIAGDVPTAWAEVGFLSMKPLTAWLVDLEERVRFFSRWAKDGQPNAFWMSAFFYPQGFLSSVLQAYARRNKVAIDGLGFGFKVLQTDNPEDIGLKKQADRGCAAHGFFIE